MEYYKTGIEQYLNVVLMMDIGMSKYSFRYIFWGFLLDLPFIFLHFFPQTIMNYYFFMII